MEHIELIEAESARRTAKCGNVVDKLVFLAAPELNIAPYPEDKRMFGAKYFTLSFKSEHNFMVLATEKEIKEKHGKMFFTTDEKKHDVESL